jgi:FlaA1/EpsC-like NDP-sugar epimerase
MMEENPVAAVENNLFGTGNLIRSCRKHGVRRFVHITTDKAVNPVSVYGASKYLCERLVLAAAEEGNRSRREPERPRAGGAPNFMVVRFGNVLGSRGSIMPLFQRQIEKGGPVTVTHPEMRRWFMTIPEACSLVLKAGGVGENGSLYLLDMGEPVRIRDMAEQMIRFYGFEPESDIKIEYVGLRPGEKIGETLWAEDEEPRKTEYSRILKVDRKDPHTPDIHSLMERLGPVCRLDPARPGMYRDSALLREILGEAIPGLQAVQTAAGAEGAAEAEPLAL